MLLPAEVIPFLLHADATRIAGGYAHMLDEWMAMGFDPNDDPMVVLGRLQADEQLPGPDDRIDRTARTGRARRRRRARSVRGSRS